MIERLDSSKRRFLALAGGAVAVAGCSSSSGRGPQMVGKVSAGASSSFPLGTLQAVGSQPVAIGHDANGIYALTLTCTHAQCEVGVVGQGFVCPCHGSRYDAVGNVQAGPAPSPLAHFSVTVDAQGNLVVDTGTFVSASTRLKV